MFLIPLRNNVDAVVTMINQLTTLETSIPAVTAPLLRLSEGEGSAYLPTGEAPCRYLVVDRGASSAALLAYVASLQADRIASDEARDVYQLR